MLFYNLFMDGLSIWPKGENLRNAVRWLAKQENKNLAAVEEACQRFNLSPSDEDFLIRHFISNESFTFL